MKCEENNCKAEATHVPKICVPATGWPTESHTPLGAIMNVQLCLTHCREFPAKAQFTDPATSKTWRDIFLFMQQAHGSECPPDFDRAFITPVPLDSEEYLMMEKAVSGPTN